MKKASPPLPLWIAALGGFIAGALAVSVILSFFGNVIGSRDARRPDPAAPVAAIDRWGTDLDGGSVAVIEHAPSAATSGETGAATAGASTPSIGTNPTSVLRDRNLMVPVPGIQRDQLHSSFSENRGATRKHEAIDILAPRNTRSRVDGRIARLFLSRDGGITVYQFDQQSSTFTTTPTSNATRTDFARETGQERPAPRIRWNIRQRAAWNAPSAFCDFQTDRREEMVGRRRSGSVRGIKITGAERARPVAGRARQLIRDSATSCRLSVVSLPAIRSASIPAPCSREAGCSRRARRKHLRRCLPTDAWRHASRRYPAA